MSHPANNLAAWKIRKILRRVENLSWSDLQNLTKEQLVQRSLNYTIVSYSQESIFPTALRIGNGVGNPYEHIHYLPTASIIKKRRG